MEKKQRVPKGERYWHLYIGSRNITTMEKTDYYNSTDDDYFKSGDYFTTQEEAEQMASKLRTVLAGADVIEMPSEEEMVYAKPIDEFYVRPSVEQYETPRR